MPLLPAVVPDIPENRAEVAAARLARKVAPLFGVPWADGPFGDRTWVCDYAKITLSEIARGAPLPTRAQAGQLDEVPEGTWDVVRRIGVAGRAAGLPNEIANATLNRFGPDTRAAVVLTAVNRLLLPVLDAARTALALLVDEQQAPLPVAHRLAAWAGLVIEVFRSQPALVAAGIHARAIQHELVQHWQLPLATRLADLPLTRCEIDPARTRATTSETEPSTLDVADLTFTALRLAPEREDPAGPVATDEPPGLAARLRHDESVDVLLRRLLAAGTAAESSFLWMSERAPGQLAVEALLPPTEVIDRFVRHSQRLLDPGASTTEPGTVFPAIPSAEQLAALPVLARRAVLIALLAVLRHMQHSPGGRESSRAGIVPVLRDVADLARRTLDVDDPVSALTECRVADMIVQTLRPDAREDLREPLQDLLAGLVRCEDLLRRGLLDRGAAAEAISSACVELNAVARSNAEHPGSGLPSPDKLLERLRDGWLAYHEALEIPPFSAASGLPRPPGLAGYHLHNYAAFLTTAASTDAELEEAVALFRGVVLPSREEFVARSGYFTPLRHSLQIASRATSRLAGSARDRGDRAAAVGWAALGRELVIRALADEETQRLLRAEPTESACRFALLAAPALVLAVEVGAPGAGTDIPRARELVGLARRWESRTGAGEHYSRHSEVLELEDRLAAVTG